MVEDQIRNGGTVGIGQAKRFTRRRLGGRAVVFDAIGRGILADVRDVFWQLQTLTGSRISPSITYRGSETGA